MDLGPSERRWLHGIHDWEGMALGRKTFSRASPKGSGGGFLKIER